MALRELTKDEMNELNQNSGSNSNAKNSAGFRELTNDEMNEASSSGYIKPKTSQDQIYDKLRDFLTGGKLGVKQFGEQTGENVLKLANKFTGHGGELAESLQQKLNQLRKDPSYLQAMQRNPITTRAGEFAGGALPYGASLAIPGLGEAGLAARMGAMGGIGALSSEQPLVGGITGALGEGAGSKIVGPALSKAGSFLTTPNLKRLATDALEKLHIGNRVSDENNKAFDESLKNLRNLEEKEGSSHRKVESMADKLTKSGDYKVNNDKYENAINKRIVELKKSLEHGSSPEVSNEIDRLIDWHNAPHDTLKGLIEHNKFLNNQFKMTNTPLGNLSHTSVKYGIANLKNTIDENLDRLGLKGTLGKSINEANDLTKNKYKNFMENSSSPNESKVSEFSKTSKNYDANGNIKNLPKNLQERNVSLASHETRGNFISDYLPKGKDEGAANFERLSNMLGDKQKARDLLRKNLLANETEETGVMKKYNNLDEKQKEWLFSPAERKKLDKFNYQISKQKNKSLYSIIGKSQSPINREISRKLSETLKRTPMGAIQYGEQIPVEQNKE
jgi:hypothetical protein